MKILQNAKFVNGFSPVADAYNGDIETDIINMKNWDRCTFILHEGVGTAATGTITVEACDDVAASNSEAVEFRYKALTTGDTEGDATAATTAGFATTAGSDDIYVVEVGAADLTSDYQYVRMAIAEVSATPAMLAGCVAILSGGSDQGDDLATSIV